jgi:hypothetical protein
VGQRNRNRIDIGECTQSIKESSYMCELMEREAYYRRMARRYRELAAGSPDLEMADCWRAAGDDVTS